MSPDKSSSCDPFRLSSSEFEMLSELTSRQFGHLRMDEGEGGAGGGANARRRRTALKTVALLEGELAARACTDARRGARKRPRTDEEGEAAGEKSKVSPTKSAVQEAKKQEVSSSSVDPKLYRKLGHLHLLLENFARALSAYEKYSECGGAAAKTDLDYLYGSGLVYFHFGAYHRACRAFQELLYLSPNFDRAIDVHARLGLMRKSLQSFRRSLTHFKICLRCSSAKFSSLSSFSSNSGAAVVHSPPFSDAQVRFHVAHLHEVHGKFSKAMSMYRTLLAIPNAPQSLQSDVNRQIGWIFYSGLRGGVQGTGEEDKTSRIMSAIQHLQKSLELDPKSGQCLYLLGRCYASIGKVHEAFIAYRNSVDKSESNADTWCSIGVLYQQQNQPMDALQAYICAVQLEKFHGPAWTNLGMLYESTHQFQDALTCYTNAVTKCQYSNPLIQQRIKYLKAQLSNVMLPPPPPGQQGSSPYKVKPLPAVEEAWNLPVSNEMTGRHSSKAGKQNDSARMRGRGEEGKTPPLTAQQMQTLHYLQSQQGNLNPQQQQALQQLQQQLNMFKQQQQARQQQQQQQQQQGSSEEGEGDQGEKPKESGEKGDLTESLSQPEIESFAEDLLKEIEQNDAEKNEKNGEENKENGEGTSGQEATNTKMDILQIPAKLEKVSAVVTLDANHEMKAEDIVQKCKQWARTLSPDAAPVFRRELPTLPKLPSARLSKEQLLPPTPSVHLENKKDAFSPQLQHFCLEHPIAVIRGIAAALKLDLGLFSTKCVVETNPTQRVHIETQVKQKSDENWDISFSKQVWLIDSKRSRSTIADYATYQLAVFQEGLREEKNSKGDMDDPREDPRRTKKSQMYLQLATCPDISDVKNWRLQLTELLKLPAWARVVSGGNMLSHIGYPIPGANTVNLHMQVPCSRLGARQDIVNFSSVNINIGPGDCEWFAVPYEYWSSLVALCEKHNVDFHHDAWWPNMKDLMDGDIPVYRFLQRPGDMVWVNAGCIYWVQASGWCNSIKWNVGPLSNYQYQMALQKWRRNRLQFTRSLVPMAHLSWNLARNIKLSDDALHLEVKKFLFETLKEFVVQREHLRQLEVKVTPQHRKRNDPVYYCGVCGNEIFGLIFLEEEEEEEVKPQEGGAAADGAEKESPSNAVQTICCFSCAKMKSSRFQEMVCIEEQSLTELTCTYDNFKVQGPQAALGGMHGGAAAAAAAAGFNPSNAAAAAAAYAAAAGMNFNNLLPFC